jgi:hypothetical protein
MNLNDRCRPFIILYNLAERQFYNIWINIPKNKRRIHNLKKCSKIRSVVRGKFDKYGKKCR